MNVYEKDDTVAQYIEFHYGDSYFGVPNFPVACIAEASRHLNSRQTQRALDIGCATGRSSIELARHFDHVDALDFSARLVQAPTALQSSGIQRYALLDEGDLMTFKEVTIDDLGYQNIKDKVSFTQGDACNLPEKFADYDLVFTDKEKWLGGYKAEPGENASCA